MSPDPVRAHGYERIFEVWRWWPGTDESWKVNPGWGPWNTRMIRSYMREEEDMIRRRIVEPSVYVVRLAVKP